MEVLKSMTDSKKLCAKDIATFGMLGGIMFAAKVAMGGIPNIEPVSLLVMVYATVLGKKALYPIYTYVALEYCLYGFHLWSVNYLYIWLILYVVSRTFAEIESPYGWGIISGMFGLFFGLLCTPVYVLSGGLEFALSWWISGIPYDILHGIGNFVLAFVLFNAIRKLLEEKL